MHPVNRGSPLNPPLNTTERANDARCDLPAEIHGGSTEWKQMTSDFDE